jgi:hypothetical protein
MKDDVSAIDRTVQLPKLLVDHDRDSSEEDPLIRQKEALPRVVKSGWDAIRGYLLQSGSSTPTNSYEIRTLMIPGCSSLYVPSKW